jgi:hypothetical protein
MLESDHSWGLAVEVRISDSSRCGLLNRYIRGSVVLAAKIRFNGLPKLDVQMIVDLTRALAVGCQMSNPPHEAV